MPVRLSCEDEGFCLEVVSASVRGSKAEIVFSLQDLEEERLDETVDLYDSASIHTPFPSISNCTRISYDADTQTALFLLTVEQQGGKAIRADKLTLSMQTILTSKQTYEGILPNADWENLPWTAQTQMVDARGLGGRFGEEASRGEGPETYPVLQSAGSFALPVSGAELTGVGYVDGDLHVQVYYENILETDNHGEIVLREKETGDLLFGSSTVSFWDEAGWGSYYDTVFEDLPEESLEAYELYGSFVVAPEKTEGNWSITFPLESKEYR